MNEKIVLKKIVSLTLAFSFLIMSITGIMLYIVPKGKIAYWSNWKMLGLTKTQYGDIHITSMILFIVIAIWHIYYNWKPLISYLKNSTKQITIFKKEFLIALAVNILFVVGTLMGMQPFKVVLDINENIKEYWEEQYGSPPYGHAEESSLKSFSQRIGIDIENAMELLNKQGVVLNSQKQTLKQIAEENEISAQVIYDIIRQKKSIDTSKESNSKEITSIGRRTLNELANMKKIDLEKSILFLKDKGFDATPQSRMREVANELEKTPYELYAKLKAL